MLPSHMHMLQHSCLERSRGQHESGAVLCGTAVAQLLKAAPASAAAAAAAACCCRASGGDRDALRELREAERKLQQISSQEAQAKVRAAVWPDVLHLLAVRLVFYLQDTDCLARHEPTCSQKAGRLAQLLEPMCAQRQQVFTPQHEPCCAATLPPLHSRPPGRSRTSG